MFQLINFQKISEISREYSENDLSIQEVVNYIQSDEMNTAWEKFVGASEVEDITHWIQSHGVNVEREIHELSSVPDSGIITPSRLRMRRSVQNYSVQAFEDEIKEQILVKDLNILIDKLVADGHDFAHLYLILNLSRPALEKLFHEPEILQAAENLKNLGIDVGYLKSLVYKLLRWN